MDAVEALATWRKLPPRARARVTDALRKRERSLIEAIAGQTQKEETTAHHDANYLTVIRSAIAVLDAP